MFAGLADRSTNRPPSNITDIPMTPNTSTTTMITDSSFTISSNLPKPLMPWTNIRLPSNLVPIHYNIELQPILTPKVGEDYTFYGNSSVLFTVQKATPFIIIHSRNLIYLKVMVFDQHVSCKQ